MSFLNKLTDNKQMLIAAVGGLTAGFMLFIFNTSLYRMFRGSPKIETAEDMKKRHIEILKRQLQGVNLTIEDVKKIMELAVTEARAKVADYKKQFKQKRLGFTRQSRKQNMEQYLRTIAQGMQQMQTIAVHEQQKLFQEIGITQMQLAKFHHLLSGTMQEIMTAQHQDISHLVPMTIEEAKFALRKQIEFLNAEGQECARLILNATQRWPAQRKAALPLIISTFIADSAYEGYPQLDDESVQHALSKYSRQVMGEMQQLQVAMTLLLLRLNLINNSQFSFGFDDFSLAAGGTFTTEQVEQLRNIENMQYGQMTRINQMAQKLMR